MSTKSAKVFLLCTEVVACIHDFVLAYQLDRRTCLKVICSGYFPSHKAEGTLPSDYIILWESIFL